MSSEDICSIDLEKLELIGKGSFGKIYRMKGKDSGKVIKEVKIGNRSPYMYNIVEQVVKAELYALVKIRQLEVENISHNFATLYDFAKCYIKESDEVRKQREYEMRKNKKRYIDYSLKNVGVRLVMKYYPMNFNQLIRRMLVDTWKEINMVSVWINIMFKLWYSIHVMHEKMGIVHMDLDINNVMFEPLKNEMDIIDSSWQEAEERRGYSKYVLHGDVFYVSNRGYGPIIIDFGASKRLDQIESEEEREKLKKNDYKFFFNEEEQNSLGGLLFRKNDIRESVYNNYTVQELIEKLGGKNSEIVKKAFSNVRKKHPHLKGKRFMKKIHGQLARIIKDNLKLYKGLDRNFEHIQAVQRPTGVIKEFFKRLKSKKGWKLEDMHGKLNEINILE